MYPFIEIGGGLWPIYVFGLTLTICFFAFLWMLKKLAKRFSADFSFFTENILWYFLSVFIFSRLFYVISQIQDLQYIDNPIEFFLMSDYNFSLAGAIVGFFIVLLINLKVKKEKLQNYIDPLILSFLFILIIGYTGSFLGGQVYGRDTSIGIEILYSNSFSPIPYQVPVFPLPIVYAIVFFILFSSLYIASMYIKIKGLIGYLGMIAFASFILIFEFFSGKYDILKNYLNFNIMQLFALIVIGICGYQLYKLMKSPEAHMPVFLKDKIK